MSDDCIFKTFVVNAAEYDNGNKETSGAWLTFPTTKDEVSALFKEIGLPNNADSGQYFIDEYRCGNNDLLKILPTHGDIDELNYLANRISELEDIEMTVFQTAIQTDECKNIKDAINITYNTERFDIVSDMSGWENIGAYIAEREGLGVDVIGDLSYYVDYEAYGRDRAEKNCGYLLDDIYLEKDLSRFTDKYNGDIEDIPPEYIVTEYGAGKQRDYRLETQLKASMELACEIDEYLSKHSSLYVSKYTKDNEPPIYISDSLINSSTLALKDMLTAANTSRGDALVDKICEFEKQYPCDKYMIYQLKDGDETRDYRFASYAQLEKQGLSVNRDNYEQKYVHSLSATATPEKLFAQFNTELPRDFTGHSMSVSDIVVLQRNGEEKAYYCDSAGFVETPEFFNENCLETAEKSAEQNEPRTITALVVEPMREPYVKEIQTGLEVLQKEVGGDIQVVYPFAEPIGLICNEEGKIMGLDLNRALYDAKGEMYDIVAGTFILTGLGDEDFTSLPPEHITQMTERFKRPELFVKVNDEIKAVHVKPSIKAALDKLKKERDGGDKPQPRKTPPNREL